MPLILIVVLVVAILCYLFAMYVSPSANVTRLVCGIVFVLLVLWIFLHYHDPIAHSLVK